MPFQRKYESYDAFVKSSISHLLGNRYALPLNEIKTSFVIEDLSDVFSQIFLFTLSTKNQGWIDKTPLAMSKALHHLLKTHDVRTITPSEPYHKIGKLEKEKYEINNQIKKMYSTDVLIIEDLTFLFKVYKFINKDKDPVLDQENTQFLKDLLMDVLEYRLSESCAGKITLVGYERPFGDIKEIYGDRMIDILSHAKTKVILLD